jgi:hypothetical protein
MPNAFNPLAQVSGGLSDGKSRAITADVACLFASGGLYGAAQTEVASQWYAIYAIAANTDTAFVLKAMPIMRVKSQASQVISCSELKIITNARNYVFNADDALIVGGKVYFLSGANKGLMRTIIHNNVVSSATTIEYSGGALTLTAGDWFIILPPAGTNFRLIGTVFNNASSNIVKFVRLGNVVNWLDLIPPTAVNNTVVEYVPLACPLATGARAAVASNSEGVQYIGHHLSSGSQVAPAGISVASPLTVFTTEFNLEFCRYYGYGIDNIWGIAYSYPPGSGY